MSFFRRKDQNGGSRDGDEGAKFRENDSLSSLSDDVFSDGLNSPVLAKMFFNCLRNIETQVKDLTAFQEETVQPHVIKVTESLQSVSDRFDILEQTLKEKDEKIKELERKIDILEEKNEDLITQNQNFSVKLDDLEQYSRRNCLLLHGVKENEEENTDEIVLSTIAEEMGIHINEEDIDRTHRLGKPNRNDGKPRPIIIKFTRYAVRHKVFVYKRSLKGKRLLITESLTAYRMKLLVEAQKKFEVKNVWTSDGRILYKVNNRVMLYKS